MKAESPPYAKEKFQTEKVLIGGHCCILYILWVRQQPES